MGVFIDVEEEPVTEEVPAVPEKPVKDVGAKYIVLPILFEMLLLGILFLKNRTASMNYLYALIPLLLATAFIGTYVYNREGNMKMFMAMACLTSLGTALQVLIDQVYNPISSFSLIKMVIGIAIAIIFIAVYTLFRKALDYSITLYIMMIISAAIYVVLLIAGTDPNGYGTSAWIRLGSVTVQLTDVTKVSAVLFYASLFSPRAARTEKQVLWLCNIFFLINLVGSLLIRELGSFFILFFLHISILYIFMRHGKKKRTYLIVVFCAIVLAVIMVFVL